MLVEAHEANAVHILVFQHHPWFLRAEDEADEYFNIPQQRRRTAIRAMKEAGVRAVFAGHYHRNSYGTAGSIEMITSGPIGRPLGNDPSGLRVVEVYVDRIAHTYYGIDDVPHEIELEK